MKNGDWCDLKKKREAILRVIRYIIAHPEAGQQCIGHGRPPFAGDVQAHHLFEDPNIGNIKIPDDARVIFFASGEDASDACSSLIIELPPHPFPSFPAFSGQLSDTELLAFVLGNYRYWRPPRSP